MDEQWERLAGTWTLIDVTDVDGDGTVRSRPYGATPQGQLIYTRDARMAVVIAGAGPAPAVAYAGTAVVEGDVVRHEVRVGLPPFTRDQQRYARLDEQQDRLVLATRRPGLPRMELVWRRLHAETAHRPAED
ncbi:lipocalin-like domain-containing protein [Streptomyces fuscigenes]|uniref:lipocalin-like domain-containing protein n=1 Tax=Streptomyces fuscigenes TaxID=1528880 RepID=UPI001F4236FD|nr:lipocalin-like domain-containing protein [Streptomyces fuscigenes]MCF3961468.1 lipocalin-like domain-containing protein [Streptomyces fuscigenes]